MEVRCGACIAFFEWGEIELSFVPKVPPSGTRSPVDIANLMSTTTRHATFSLVGELCHKLLISPHFAWDGLLSGDIFLSF